MSGIEHETDRSKHLSHLLLLSASISCRAFPAFYSLSTEKSARLVIFRSSPVEMSEPYLLHGNLSYEFVPPTTLGDYRRWNRRVMLDSACSNRCPSFCAHQSSSHLLDAPSPTPTPTPTPTEEYKPPSRPKGPIESPRAEVQDRSRSIQRRQETSVEGGKWNLR
jgi:hypothetical protein